MYKILDGGSFVYKTSSTLQDDFFFISVPIFSKEKKRFAVKIS